MQMRSQLTLQDSSLVVVVPSMGVPCVVAGACSEGVARRSCSVCWFVGRLDAGPWRAGEAGSWSIAALEQHDGRRTPELDQPSRSLYTGAERRTWSSGEPKLDAGAEHRTGSSGELEWNTGAERRTQERRASSSRRRPDGEPLALGLPGRSGGLVGAWAVAACGLRLWTQVSGSQGSGRNNQAGLGLGHQLYPIGLTAVCGLRRYISVFSLFGLHAIKPEP
jgi:hypothetical protein